MQTPLPRTLDERGTSAPQDNLRRALAARRAAILAGRRPTARLLDACPPVSALTLVVADLTAASAVWSARLGGHGEPLDPAQFDEPGLAQQFNLGPCALILFQPTEDTDASDFLLDHGDGLYGIALRDGAVPIARGWRVHHPLALLPPSPHALSLKLTPRSPSTIRFDPIVLLPLREGVSP